MKDQRFDFHRLSMDELFVICSFLRYYDILNLQCINREFYSSCSDDVIYRIVYDQLKELRELFPVNQVYNPQRMIIESVKENERIIEFPIIKQNYRMELIQWAKSRKSSGINFAFMRRNEVVSMELMNLEKFQSRVIVLGDDDTGKTSLIYKLVDNPLDFENGTVEYCGNVFKFIETPFIYSKMAGYIVDLCIICYSITSWKSFENVKKKWIRQIRYHSPNTPVILLGTKSDLGDNEQRSYFGDLLRKVTVEEGENLARQLKCISFAEVSMKSGEGLPDFFQYLTNIQLLSSKIILEKSKWNCVLL